MREKIFTLLMVFCLSNTMVVSAMEAVWQYFATPSAKVQQFNDKNPPKELQRSSSYGSLGQFGLPATSLQSAKIASEATAHLGKRSSKEYQSTSGSSSSDDKARLVDEFVGSEPNTPPNSDQEKFEKEEPDRYSLMSFLQHLFPDNFDICSMYQENESKEPGQKNEEQEEIFQDPQQIAQLFWTLKIVEHKAGKTIRGAIETGDLTRERVADIFKLRSPREYAAFLKMLFLTNRAIDKEFTSQFPDRNGESKVYKNVVSQFFKKILKAYTITEDNQFDFSPLTLLETLKRAMPCAFREHKRKIKGNFISQTYPNLWEKLKAGLSPDSCDEEGLKFVENTLKLCTYNAARQKYETSKLTSIPTMYDAMPEFVNEMQDYMNRQKKQPPHDETKTSQEIKTTNQEEKTDKKQEKTSTEKGSKKEKKHKQQPSSSLFTSRTACCFYTGAALLGSQLVWAKLPIILATLKPYYTSVLKARKTYLF